MRMDSTNGYGDFTVYDVAMARIIEHVNWIDDTSLQVCVIPQPPRLAATGWTLHTEIIPVSSVSVDYPAQRITVNTCVGVKVIAAPAQHHDKPPAACEECRQEDTCRRIHYCAAYRCEFGEALQP